MFWSLIKTQVIIKCIIVRTFVQRGEVSLYGWSPVWLAWISLHTQVEHIIFLFGRIQTSQLETSCTLILPPTVSVLCQSMICTAWADMSLPINCSAPRIYLISLFKKYCHFEKIGTVTRIRTHDLESSRPWIFSPNQITKALGVLIREQYQ